MIIMNELEYAEKMIDSRELGSKPFTTLVNVGKYYLHNKYSKREARKMLEDYLVRCNPNASRTEWASSLDRAMTIAAKSPPVQIDGIDIYCNELETINAINGVQRRRLAFTLLCIAKFMDRVNPKNNHWTMQNDTEVMDLANIRTPIRRQCMLFNSLRDGGYIQYSKRVDNLNVRVLFIQQSGDVAMHISDFRNLGYQYMKMFGGPYYECQNCGIVFKTKNTGSGRNPKYCPECAAEIWTKQKIDAVMRHRNLPKNVK